MFRFVLSWFSLYAGRKDWDFIICITFHIPFSKLELTHIPTLLISSVKWPPPRSESIVQYSTIRLLCAASNEPLYGFGKRVKGVLCYTGPFDLFPHITRQLGELRVSKWDCGPGPGLETLFAHWDNCVEICIKVSSKWQKLPQIVIRQNISLVWANNKHAFRVAQHLPSFCIMRATNSEYYVTLRKLWRDPAVVPAMYCCICHHRYCMRLRPLTSAFNADKLGQKTYFTAAAKG